MTRLDLSKTLTREEVNKIAKESKFKQREGGKIDPYDFLLTLVYRFSGPISPALRLITSLLKKHVSRSGVHQRYTERGSLFFRECLQLLLLKRTFEWCPLKVKALEPFKRVLVFDSTGWELSSHLKSIFPGFGGCASKAGLKIQLGFDYKSGALVLLEETKGTKTDQEYSRKIADTVEKGDLVLFDLGYWAFLAFQKIIKKGGYLLSRFDTKVNIWMVKEGEHIKVSLEGVLKAQTADSAEMDVIIGNNEKGFIKVRLVAFRISEELANIRRNKLYANAKKKGRIPKEKNLYFCNWSMYITSAPQELVDSRMIRSIYRVRWCIELIFKSWKSILKIHISNVRKNHHRFKCELYAKLIFAVIVHSIHHHLQAYVWSLKRKEISFYKLWSFIVSKVELIHEGLRTSTEKFSDIINSLFKRMIKTCEKHHQPSRKTTLQLMEEMIGDIKTQKINLIDYYAH